VYLRVVETKSFIPIDVLATKLAIPQTWLRTEADAARIPCLKIGRRRLFDLDTVRRVLTERAAESSEAVPDAR
jgi:hypothetical protein